jgi:hypothetical protein
LTIVRTRHGGHCGFAERLNGPSFADRLVLAEFERFDREARRTNAKDDATAPMLEPATDA